MQLVGQLLMQFNTPITIKDTINNIKKKQYVLPSIQREFVWDTNQIETLFDSLMRDYLYYFQPFCL